MAGADDDLAVWRSLTRLEEKAQAYSEDPVARAALDTARAGGEDLRSALGDVSLVLVKSEALVSGRAAVVERFLDGHEICVEGGFDVDLDAARSHALWSYPWVKATSDRMRLHVMMSAGKPSRCLIVRRAGASSPEPLSVWLADRKGPSARKQRRPTDLRSALGMSNRMISYVHCPDEPADVVRDAYVLAGERGVQRLLAAATPSRPRTARGFDEVNGAAPVDLKLAGVLERLPAEGRTAALAALAARADGRPRRLQDAIEDARAWGADNEWDRCVLAAELIAHDLPEAAGRFDRLSVRQLAEAWRSADRGPAASACGTGS
ncbi:hypothetical protein [Cellulomonas xiejunii]|uniref:hypothetical protein n=1 Tax=Cellulomonas xiejunii TaxID=2968083 RepID=UPI001D0E668D|nr:hypothetical protein [Cellulomonas xiejunii]MCC2314009.1 hypothetical protein [Cellulomonas xiejunii]